MRVGRSGICALLLYLWAGGAVADDYDEYRVACTAAEETAAQAAVARARDLVGAALDALPPVNSEGGARFQRWFGGADGEYDAVVHDVYAGILVSLSFSSIWCPNTSLPDPDIDPGTWAFVPGDAVDEMFLMAPFFDLGTSGADSRAGVIIHEASHLSAVSDVVDSDVTGDNEADYGIENAEQLARVDADRARSTADNYQYFAEDLAFGI